MKRKVYPICILFLLFLGLLIIVALGYCKKNKMSALYKEYRYPNEEYYGKDLYSEIDYKCSDYELQVGNEIVNKGLEVLQYTGTEQDAEAEMGDVGALSRYYYFDRKNVVSQDGNFRFITCRISGNEGHI